MNETMKILLKKKANELNEDAPNDLNEVVDIVGNFNSFLDDKIILNEKEISELIKKLLFSTISIPIPIPLSEQLYMCRGRKCDGPKYANFTNTSELSYISKPKSSSVNLGRMNKSGSAIFYASFGRLSAAHSAVIAELDGKKGDVFNIMECQLNPVNQGFATLDLVPIGFFDYFRRDAPLPFELTKDMKIPYDIMVKNTSQEAMRALNLCDAFLTSILTSESQENLYKLTSEVAHSFLEIESTDGIIYPSTKIIGHPNVAINPDVVDSKIRFTSVQRIEILEVYGYGLFSLKTIDEGKIENGTIHWESV